MCWWPGMALGQAVPYARSFAKPKEEVERTLQELQANSGQKLPILEGFVATPAKPIERYERGFCQFNIELLPGDAGATIVRISAKITAWYADRDVAKSGYEVLVSNGRLELDFLDRLEEKITGTSASPPSGRSPVQAPRPKLDLSGAPGAEAAAMSSRPLPEEARSPDEIAKLHMQREAAEKHTQQLASELQNLREIQRNQAHPQNLVIVKKSGTPVYDKGAENSRVLFQAAANDEFEFLDEGRGWIHVTISGDSRGYIQRDAAELPERLAERLQSSGTGPEEKFAGFRIEREETSIFPGDWAQLRGKKTKIYTVQIISQDRKESGPTIRRNYALALFEKGLKETAGTNAAPDGIVVIFDAADGGIAAATIGEIQKIASGEITRNAFWSQCHLDPPETFRPSAKP